MGKENNPVLPIWNLFESAFKSITSSLSTVYTDIKIIPQDDVSRKNVSFLLDVMHIKQPIKTAPK